VTDSPGRRRSKVAAALLIGTTQPVAPLAFLAAAGLAAVLLYRYLDIPAFRPVPSMSEPVWFFQQSLRPPPKPLRPPPHSACCCADHRPTVGSTRPKSTPPRSPVTETR
jgi:hypothetical protein